MRRSALRFCRFDGRGDLAPENRSSLSVRIFGDGMPRRSYSTEQIVRKLRQAECGARPRLAEAAGLHEAGVSEQTYYRRRKEYGELRLDQAKRLKELDGRTPDCSG